MFLLLQIKLLILWPCWYFQSSIVVANTFTYTCKHFLHHVIQQHPSFSNNRILFLIGTYPFLVIDCLFTGCVFHQTLFRQLFINDLIIRVYDVKVYTWYNGKDHCVRCWASLNCIVTTYAIWKIENAIIALSRILFVSFLLFFLFFFWKMINKSDIQCLVLELN